MYAKKVNTECKVTSVWGLFLWHKSEDFSSAQIQVLLKERLEVSWRVLWIITKRTIRILK
jgi:hypothetical protein